MRHNDFNDELGDLASKAMTLLSMSVLRTQTLSPIIQRTLTTHKLLSGQEHNKKHKYLDTCVAQRQYFTPFVISTDGLVGCKAKELLKGLALHLSDKWEQPYSVVCGFVNARISITIVYATHLCL
jgi:hypothetical protein